jgi:hypothetical protein
MQKMVELTERKLGYGFGLLGGALFLLGALVSIAVGTLDLVIRHPFGALGAMSEAVVLLVVGGLALLFAYLGHRAWSDRPLVSGVLLVLLAGIGWAALGFGDNVIALVGALFVFLAGVLFLIEPTRHAVATAVASS